MTPKEKAMELVGKFIHVVSTNGSLASRELRREQNAKYCALVAANEVIEEIINNCDGGIYWQKVKTEIGKL